MEKTEWYPPDSRPVRVGVYEVYSPNGSGYWLRYWTGDHWRAGHSSVYAAENSYNRAEFQDAPWRGLKENPHAD